MHFESGSAFLNSVNVRNQQRLGERRPVIDTVGMSGTHEKQRDFLATAHRLARSKRSGGAGVGHGSFPQPRRVFSET
jgi:hypothetical protein